MMLRLLVKGRIHNLHILPFDGALNIRYLLRAFINQQYNQMHFLMVAGDCICYLRQKDCFPNLRRCNNHPSLPFADRRNQINDATGEFSLHCFQLELLLRINRCQLLKIRAMNRKIWRISIDRLHINQTADLFAFSGRAYIPHHSVACFQIKSANLRRRNIHIICTGQAIFRTQKPISIRQYLQNPLSQFLKKLLFPFRMLLRSFGFFVEISVRKVGSSRPRYRIIFLHLRGLLNFLNQFPFLQTGNGRNPQLLRHFSQFHKSSFLQIAHATLLFLLWDFNYCAGH